jgi:hypothetical protein
VGETNAKQGLTIGRILGVGGLAGVIWLVLGAKDLYYWILDEFFIPKIVEFQAVPRQITKGESATLRWEVAERPKPDTVLLDGEAVLPKGEKQISPGEDTVYVLVARGKRGEDRRQERIVVLLPRIRLRLTSDRTAVRRGEVVTISWEASQDAEHVSIQPFFGVVERTGARAVTINEETKFTITAQGPSGSETREITITVLETTVELTVDPPVIHAGQRAVLRWETNAPSVELRAAGLQDMGTFPGVGTLEIAPAANTTYELVATGPGGEKVARASLAVLPPLAPVLRLSTEPQRIRLGESSQISWATENCTKVRIEGIGEFGPSGSVPVRPSATGEATYRLTAIGPGGEASQEALIVVLEPPRPRLAVLGLEQAEGLRDPRAAAQAVTEHLTSFFKSRYDIVAPSEHHNSARAEYVSIASLRAQRDRKQRDIAVARFDRVEITVQATIRTVRLADRVVVGEGSGKAKKSATLAWETPYVSGRSASPEARLEAEVVNLAIADAITRYGPTTAR